MEEFITQLFKNEEVRRLESFINKMKDFKSQCSTNQQEQLIRRGLFAAEALLKKLS